MFTQLYYIYNDGNNSASGGEGYMSLNALCSAVLLLGVIGSPFDINLCVLRTL